MPYTQPLTRRTDPPTSDDAAEAFEVRGDKARHHKMILDRLRWMPSGGTGKELAEAIWERFHVRLTSVQVMRRMAELLDAGLAHRKLDRDAPPRPDRKPVWLKRHGECIQYHGPEPKGDMPLFQE